MFIRGSQVDVSFPEIEKFDAMPEPRAEGATAFVSIIEGCSKFCTFCVVPYTRGAEVSRPAARIVEEAQRLAEGGVPPEELTGKGADFVKRYKDKFKAEPQAYAVYGYTAAKAVLDVLGQTGKKDRELVRQTLAGYEQKDGALGTWNFDKNGDTTMTTMSGNVVEGGKFKFSTLLAAKP